MAIALCCHHRCDWRHYVGKEFFRQRGLGPKEFAAFQRMSSWATCGKKKFSSEMPEQLNDHKTEEEEEHEIDEESTTDTLNRWVFYQQVTISLSLWSFADLMFFLHALAVWCRSNTGNRSVVFVNFWSTKAECITSSKEDLNPAWNTIQAETCRWRTCY